MTKKFKFKIGQYVRHLGGGIRPSKMLIVSRGQMEEPGGGSKNLYVCALASTWGSLVRVFGYEHELVDAGELEPVSGVRSAWRELGREIPGEYVGIDLARSIDTVILDGPFLKVDEIKPDHHGPASD